MDTTQTQLDPQAVNLVKAIRQTESGGNFQAKGKSGEYGAYQFTAPTWDAYSKKHGINVPIEQATPEQQNEVAYKQIKEWKDAGHNVGEIASMWNAGEGNSNAYLQNHTGTNKYGVHYDTPTYAKSVANAYQTIKNGGQISQDPSNPSSTTHRSTFTESIPEQSQQNNITDNNPILETATDLIPGNKLAKGLGYAINNISGRQNEVIKGNEKNIGILNDLAKKRSEIKRQGGNTSSLDNQMKTLAESIKSTGKSIQDIGTGGLSNKDILKSAGSLATLPVMAYASRALSGGGLLNEARGLKTGQLTQIMPKVFSNPALEGALKSVPNGIKDMAEFSKATNANKLNYLTEAMTGANPSEKLVLQKAIEEVTPKALKEMGLGPTVATKVKGLIGKLIRHAGGMAAASVAGAGGAKVYNHLIKQK